MAKRMYEVRNGLNLPNGKRLEAGEITSEIPPADIHWLQRQGHIKLAADQPIDEPEEDKPVIRSKKKGGS